jgi:hypothetical protein
MTRRLRSVPDGMSGTISEAVLGAGRGISEAVPGRGVGSPKPCPGTARGRTRSDADAETQGRATGCCSSVTQSDWSSETART